MRDVAPPPAWLRRFGQRPLWIAWGAVIVIWLTILI